MLPFVGLVLVWKHRKSVVQFIWTWTCVGECQVNTDSL